MFEPFQQFVFKAAKSYGISNELKAAKICQHLRAIIPIIFKNKPDPEKHIEPGCFKENYITIKVKSPAWAQEVLMKKEEIIKEINAREGSEIIKNIKINLA